MTDARRPPAAHERGPAPVPDAGIGPAPTPDRVDELAPGLVRLTAPNPGVMTGPGTNTYLVGSGGALAVVDPGPDDARHLRHIVDEASRRGVIRWVLTTHTHPDHAPGAAPLARRVGATLVGYEARDGFEPDVAVGDGWVLEAPGLRLQAVHTPGHAANHLCWLVGGGDAGSGRRPGRDRGQGPGDGSGQRAGDGILLSGDHVMHGATVVIRPPDGDMAAYLASLRRLRGGDPTVGAIRAVAPGHGRMIGDPAAVIDAIVAHRLEREAVVAAALVASGGGTVDELLPAVYADVAAGLLPVARFSLWAHLRKLLAEGRATAHPAGPAPAGSTGPGEGAPPGEHEEHEELAWRWEPAGK